ncbi:MAG: 50S ribosomal protein L25/general stress protein Ctc [Verrucomicrobiales bacterium]
MKLKAQPREGKGPSLAKNLRRQGLLPANVYGSKTKPISLTVSERDMAVLLGHAVGENILVDLEVESKDNPLQTMALIQEVQHQPVTGKILHIDFHAVSSDESISAEIPIEATGEAIGVKNFGGLLEHLVRKVQIHCLPKDLPEVIRVDVSHLGVGDSLHMRDLSLPSGVTTKADGDIVVFLVAAPRVSVAATDPKEAAKK